MSTGALTIHLQYYGSLISKGVVGRGYFLIGLFLPKLLLFFLQKSHLEIQLKSLWGLVRLSLLSLVY
ncbi:hypothetical protein DA11_11845 [Aeromonas caviae]|nr:hypothetical protein DA11_11845 [Aeromonas caviae]